MTDAELIEAFQNGSLSPACFHHRDHVRVAWMYLRRAPMLEAIARFSTDLRRFAASIGKPGLYHETITVALLLLMNERMARLDPDHTWADFEQAAADLLTWRPSPLRRYYREETLESDFARRVFVMPDLGLSLAVPTDAAGETPPGAGPRA